MISGASLFARSGHALPRTWGDEEEKEEVNPGTTQGGSSLLLQ